jgi:hypothetical protein
MDFIADLLQKLVDQAPMLTSLFVVVGVLRVVNKPLFAFLHTLVDATPTDVDNKVLNEVEQSKLYTTVTFVLDWLGSIKLPKK